MQRKISVSTYLILTLIVLGCARGKVSNISKDLAGNSFTKSDLILVKKFDSGSTVFSGEYSDVPQKNDQDKKAIEDRLASMVVTELNKKGFKAEVSGDDSKIVIRGKVTMFNRGSSTKRAMIGFGAGKSKFLVGVIVYRDKDLLSEFEILAHSGGRAGFTSIGSFLNGHLLDGATQISNYLGQKIVK